MKLVKFFSLAFLLCGLCLFTACNNDDDPVTPSTAKLAGATALMATSIDANTVGLKWTAATSETNSYFKGYKICVGDVAIDTLKAGTTSCNVAVNTTGARTYKVIALSSDTTKYKHADAASKTWATALRFDKNINDGTIQMYATTSSYGSGLNIFDETGAAPKTLKVASIADWTVGIDTKTSGVVKFGPASTLSYTATGAKTVEISAPVPCDDLSSLYESEELSLKSYSATAYDLEKYTTVSTKGVAFYVKETRSDGVHYAKMLLVKNGSTYLFGSGTDQYVKVAQISYQSVKDVPYAKVK